MNSTRPIRLEFMVEKNRLTADFSEAVNAMAGKFSAEMGAAIARVETAISKLNRAGLGNWDTRAASAGVDTVVRNIDRASAAVDKFNQKNRAALNPNAPTFPGSSSSSTRATPAPAPRSFAQVVNGNPILSQVAASSGYAGSGASQVASLARNITALGSSIYILKNVGEAIENFLIAPIKSFGAALIDVTDENRKFELSISGVVGGMNKAREVNDAIHAMVKDTPLTIKELQEATRGMAFIPALASKMAGGNLADIKAQITEYSTILNKLALMNPEQGGGVKGAAFAVREAEAGQFRSLQYRFNIQPQTIARTIGKSLDDLARDPALTLKALKTFTNIFVPDESVANAGTLYSVRIQKLRDQASTALRELGNSGIYDAVVEKLEKAEAKLFEYFRGDRFKGQAGRTSNALSGILDNAAKSLGAFLEAATGSKADSIGGVIEGFTRLVERLSDASRGLIPIAQNIGVFIGKIAGALSDLDNRLGRYGEFESGFGVSRLTKALFFDDKMSVEDMRRAAVSRVLQNAGLPAPGIGYMQGVTPVEAGQTDGITGYAGQLVRSVAGGGEGVPYLDFHRYPAKIALAASNLQRVVDGLDEATLRNQAALAAALKASGVLEKLNPGAGTSAHPDLDSVLKKEGLVYNFSAESSGLMAILGKISAQRKSEQEPLRQLINQAAGAFTANLGTDRNPYTAAGIFARLDKAFAREADTYVKALNQATDPGQLNQVRGDFDKLKSRYDQTRHQLVTLLEGTSQDFGVAMADAVKSLSPNVRAVLLDRIAEGTTSFAQNVRKILIDAGEDAARVAKELRYDSLPLRDRLAIQGARTGARIQDIEGGYNIPIGASAEDIMRAVARGPAAPASVNRRLADYLGGDAMREQVSLYRAALKDFNPADETSVIALSQAQDGLVGLTKRLTEARDKADLLRASFIEFGNAVEDSFQKGLADSIFNVISGTGKLKDVLLGFARDVTRAFSDMAAKNLMATILGNDSRAAGGAGITGALVKMFTTQAAANGAVWQGGFTPIHAFANGGIVNRPVIGLVGEGAYPEAVIPMPNGHSVPVQMMGGGAGSAGIFIVANHEQAWLAGARAHRDIIVDVISGDVQKGGRTHKAIRRKN